MDNPDWLTERPIAHRGLFDDERPENTLPAFRHAAASGIPIECDIQLGQDGLLLVVHDRNLRRLAGSDVSVSEVGPRQLAELRIGRTAERIPTLAEVLAEVNGAVPVLLDVRHYGLTLSSDLERLVARAISGYHGPLALQSFDPVSVTRFRRLARDHPVGQVSGSLSSAGRFASLLGRSMAANLLSRPDFISYELTALPSPYVSFWRKGRTLLAWTVHSRQEEARATGLADNFIFDGYLPDAYRQR